MAKFVCDFDTVIAAGDKLISVASDTETVVTNYASQIESDLSSWSGSAKGSFLETNTKQVELAKGDVEHLKKVGEFVKSSAQAIQRLEDELSSLSI